LISKKPETQEISKSQFDQKDIIELLKRHDEYLRHSFRLLVSWFTFFITLNWASMGWLAANFEKMSKTYLAVWVAALFAWQNLLGIVTCIVAYKYLQTEAEIVHTYEQFVKDKIGLDVIRSSAYPSKTYLGSTILMVLAMTPIFFMWIWIASLIRN